MARIPLAVGSRGLETGGVVQVPTGNPIGAAAAQAGQQISQVANDFSQRLQHRNEQVQKFATLQDFDTFNTQMQAEADKAKQNMKPGAIGLHDSMVKTYDERSSEWLSNSVPQNLKPEFEARIQASRAQFSRNAALLEASESKRFQVSGVTQRVESASASVQQFGPDVAGQWIKDVDQMIDTAPSISPAEREEMKRTARQTIQETGFRALAERDPEAAQRVAKGWGIDKGFTGAAIDRTMQLLRDKEGFKSGTYWDVNADRLGYGSDTITAADGSVRKVTRGDTVTRADAERDLRRRTQETLSGIQKTVGDEAYNRLTPNQQAALGSVAYNYGSLPQSVVAAVRSGDSEGIARSIEGLQGHNNGINRNRRLSEAALARGQGDGPVAGVYEPDARFDAVPANRRFILAGVADQEARQKAAANAAAETQFYNERFNQLQTAIIDNKAGLADVDVARKEGWLKDAGDIMRLQSQVATRDKATADAVAFGKAFSDAAYPWNPVDKDHKDMAEAGFKSLGGNMQALQTIAERTGVVPPSAALAMQGAMFSPDPARVQGALQTAANLVGGKYPDIFAGATGGDKLTEAGLSFRHYVYDRGLTADEATERIMEERTPEYERTIKAKIKSEDLNDIVKKNLSADDIRGAFDDSLFGWRRNPELTFNPEMRIRAMGDYEEIFREKYARNGDVSLSKSLAQEEMKRTWGVTNVNGSKVVMKYPPDRAPAYAGIESPADMVASQAISAIKDLNGAVVERKNLRLDEVKNTGERYLRGLPPTYILSYTDKNGHVQTIPNQFYADPEAMRAKQAIDREAAARAQMSRQSSYEQDLAVQNAVLN